MKKSKFLLLLAIFSLTGCATESPQIIGMANPASVYCEQIGGTLILKEDGGYCRLPDRTVEEWELYRKSNAI